MYTTTRAHIGEREKLGSDKRVCLDVDFRHPICRWAPSSGFWRNHKVFWGLSRDPTENKQSLSYVNTCVALSLSFPLFFQNPLPSKKNEKEKKRFFFLRLWTISPFHVPSPAVFLRNNIYYLVPSSVIMPSRATSERFIPTIPILCLLRATSPLL